MREIIILGGGISGLTAAWAAKKAYGSEAKITLLEQKEQVGGWIQTVDAEGYLFECGPRSLRTEGRGRYTLQLIEELELQSEVAAASSVASHRYIYSEGCLKRLPNGFLSCLRSPWRGMLAKAFLRDLFQQRGGAIEESIADFCTRRLGVEMHELLVDPFISGIFAGNSQQLSMAACFPTLWQWEKQQRSLCLGALFAPRPTLPTSPWIEKMAKAGLYSFKQGMQTLPRRLQERLDADIHCSATITSIESADSGVKVSLQDGRAFEGDIALSTLPLSVVEPLLGLHDQQPVAEIPYASVAVVCLGFRQRVLNWEGFGYLVPSKEKENILGVVWDSSAFPVHNRHPEETRLTVMIGGARATHFSALTSSDFTEIALEAIYRHLGIEKEPDTIYTSVCQSAIPQYNLGHEQRCRTIVDSLSQSFPTLKIKGSAFSGVGINDCIAAHLQLL